MFGKVYYTCQLGPRYEGQLTRMAEPIPLPVNPLRTHSITTLSSSRSTDRRAVTDMNGKTRALRCAPFYAV